MSAVAPGPVSTLAEPIDPPPGRRPWRWALAALLAAAVGAAVWAGHRDLLRALELLGSARPGWLLAGLAAVAVWCGAWTGVYVGALSVVRRVGRRALGDHARTSVAAVALNSAVKSGGMAGLAPFLQLGRRRGVPDPDVAAGYLIATVAADAGFLLVVGATVVVLAADGDLSGTDLWAGGVFLLLLALRLGLLAGAARNPAALRRVLGWSARLRARVLRRPGAEPDLQRADQVAAALRQASARPGRVLLPVAAATVVDLAAVAMLYAAVAAVGGGTDLRLALVAYVSSGLFAAIGPLPGGLGVVEVGTVAVLVAGGLPLAEATAAVALFRLAEFWLPLALGGLAWTRTRRRGPAPVPVPPPVPDVRRPADGARRALVTGARRRWLSTTLALVSGLGGLWLSLRGGQHPFHTGRLRPSGLRPFQEAFAAIEGGHYLLLGSGLVLVLVTRALLRGRRAAWLTTVLALGTATVGAAGLHAPAAVAVTAVATGVVASCRGAFHARGEPTLARRGLAVLLGGEALVAVYATVGLYRLDDQFRGGTTFLGSISGALRLLLMLPVDTEPQTRHAAWLIASTRLATLGVVLVAAAMLVAAVTGGRQRDDDRATVQRLLDAYATTALAHFQLLPDKHWLIAEDGRAFVGYGVHRGTAVALGGPIGAPDAVGPVAAEFLALCRRNGWRPAFHQVSEAELPVLTGLGLSAYKVGENAVVDVPSFSLEGRARKQLRSAVRRCERTGYRVEQLPHPLTEEDLARLREVSDAWSADGGHRERTFTLGQFDADQLRRTPVLVAVDADGTVQAFVTTLPPYRSADRSFDLMRRRPGAVNGVMDLLFVAMIERARENGAGGLDLGMAPFAGLEGQPGVPARVMRLLYERGGSLFNYAGLRSYKDKWGPRWEARYLVTRGEADLPAAAVAVARLGELPRGLGGRLAGLLRHWPATATFLAVQLWLMGSSAYAPVVHRQLLAAAGSDWVLLQHGQLWRLVTSPIVQASHGFIWLNLVLGLVAFALAESRLGSRRSALAFFLGDLVGSLPVLLAARLLAGLGVAAAQAHLTELDGGSSAGTWALLAAAAWTAPPRVRRRLLGIVAAVLVAALAIDRGLADVQHLVSATGTVLVLAALQRAAAARATRREEPAGMAAQAGTAGPRG